MSKEMLELADEIERNVTIPADGETVSAPLLRREQWDLIVAALRTSAVAESAAVTDQIIGQIEDRFPDWKSYRDLIDCIDCTLHRLRSDAHPAPAAPVPASVPDPDEIDYDDPRFNQGVEHVVDMLARSIGAEGWHSGDGSEDYDCDLEETLRNILAARGLYDRDTGEFAALAAPVPASVREVMDEIFMLSGTDNEVREEASTVVSNRLSRIHALASLPVPIPASEVLRLLTAEDERQSKLHEILETIREQIRLEVPPEHRPEGLFKNIQDAVYAMRGRTPLVNDVAILTALASLPAPGAAPTREEIADMRPTYVSELARSLALDAFDDLDDEHPEAKTYTLARWFDAILALKSAPAK